MAVPSSGVALAAQDTTSNHNKVSAISALV
jgi:hypothetical protein